MLTGKQLAAYCETVYEAEGAPQEKQEDGVFALDGKGNPIRLEVPDDADD